MTKQTYTSVQSRHLKLNAFLVFAKDFDSGKYDKYEITEKTSGTVYLFMHDKVFDFLKRHPGDRDSRSGVENGKEFIRLRISISEKHG